MKRKHLPKKNRFLPLVEIPTCLLQGRISKRVQQAYRLIEQELTNRYSLEMLIKEISTRRGKKLIIMEVDMPIRITGYIVALKDVDLICIRKGLDPFQKRAVILHECGHILCKHVPRYSKGEDTPTYIEYIQLPDISYARCRKTVSGYKTKREYDAETMAALLDKAIDEYENTPGYVARTLYNR